MTFQNIRITPASRDAEARGIYGWITPQLAQMAKENEAFGVRILTLQREEQHFLALCLSLMGDARHDADQLTHFSQRYGNTARRKLIDDSCALGRIGVVPGLDKMPGKLAGRIWRPATYRRLAQLLGDASANKLLRHKRRISRGDVSTIGRLPTEYRTEVLLGMIKRRRDLTEVLFAIELVRRVRTDLDDRRILASLEKAKLRKIREWVMRHFERAPFPEPPVGPIMLAGVEAMRPLTCYEDLARAAREFDNCIRNYLWNVLKGDTYFYRYAPEAGGKGVAIVELRRAPVLGWVVYEALGPENDPVCGVQRAAIVSAFSYAGILPAPQAVSPNAWFEID